MTTGDHPKRTVRLDARTLRALAHPLRIRLLGLLRSDGPATASALAARVGESSGTTSWHLRQLAEHGLITEDIGRGTRRERWWRAEHELTEVPAQELLDDPAAVDAVGVFLHEVVTHHHRAAAAFVAQASTWDRDWVQAADLSDWELPLSAAETRRLHEELHEVVDRYRRARRPGDQQVNVQLQVFPRSGPTQAGDL